MNIALKEASETEYWLELLGALGIVQKLRFRACRKMVWN